MLSEENIKNKIHTSRCGRNIIYLQEVGSTNDYAKMVAHDEPDGTLVVAETQTAGKGRMGRNWSSQSQTGIFMSLILKEGIRPQNASMITLIAAMSVTKALDRLCKDEIESYIKWPNDIVMNQKKVCGILTEMRTDAENLEYIVVGIGLNVNNESFENTITDIATSIYIETKKKYDRADIIGLIMEEFERYLGLFLEYGNLAFLKEEYNRRLVNMNNEVKILRSCNEEYIAKSIGINENGELLICKDNGSVETVMSGEVSVRGVYGYV